MYIQSTLRILRGVSQLSSRRWITTIPTLLQGNVSPEKSHSGGLYPAPNPNDLFSMKNKTVVVTGAARGIGMNLANSLAAAGADIAAIDILDEPHENFREMEKHGGKVKYYRCDVSNFDALQSTISDVVDEFGHIDSCIPSAGIVRNAEFLGDSQKDLHDVMNINVIAAYNTVQACARQMVSQKTGGTVVFIASVNGHRAVPGAALVGYTASKHAVRGMMKQLASELSPYGIRVNSLSPGPIVTDLALEIATLDPQGFKRMGSLGILKRWGETDELTGACLYLASNASRFSTGIDILVDGGMAAISNPTLA